MEQQNSQNTRIEGVSKPRTWKVILAFGIVYLVWGSTFLAIRVGVREVPPFLLAGMRFLTAGTVLYASTRFEGTPSPGLREWAAAALLGTLMFAISYGLLFWAERRVPSGIAAVMLAMIPVFMAMADVVILRARYPVLRLAVALLVGIAGVAVLTSRSLSSGEVPIDTPGACALIVAAISWSVAAALTRKVPLPASKRMSSGVQMLAGGILLTLVATLRGEFTDFQFKAVSRMAWLSLGYLIVAGSIIAFTAYLWLIHHESPTKVGTYAYVNPLVAVLLDYLLGGESIGPRAILGTLLILVGVVVITTMPAGERRIATWDPKTRQSES